MSYFSLETEREWNYAKMFYRPSIFSIFSHQSGGLDMKKKMWKLIWFSLNNKLHCKHIHTLSLDEAALIIGYVLTLGKWFKRREEKSRWLSSKLYHAYNKEEAAEKLIEIQQKA